MSWRDELRPAAFRGVAFEATDLSGESGRRFVGDECPETDDLPPTEDLGRKRPSYKLRGFVCGDDYLDQRDRILAALNVKGPGELVHPWRGRLTVQIGAVSYEHDVGGGCCTIDFECVDYGGQARPFVVASTAAAATTAAEDAVDLVIALEVSRAGVSLGVYQAAVDELYALEVYDLSTILGRLSDGTLVTDLIDPDEPFTPALMKTTIWLSDSVRALVAFARRVSTHRLPDFGTPSEATATTAYQGVQQAMRLIALTRAADLAATADYVSADAAEAALADIATALTSELETVTDVDTFNALTDLRTAITDVLTDLADRLPRLRTIEVPAVMPAIVVAFDLFGVTDLEEREAELVQLNGIGHPGFVTGPVQVLSR